MDQAGIVSARVGANIRRYRTDRGISLRRLSEMLDEVGLTISVSGLSRMEKGQRSVNVDQLSQLAEVLDLAPADILEEPVPPQPVQVRDLSGYGPGSSSWPAGVDPLLLQGLGAAQLGPVFERLAEGVNAQIREACAGFAAQVAAGSGMEARLAEILAPLTDSYRDRIETSVGTVLDRIRPVQRAALEAAQAELLLRRINGHLVQEASRTANASGSVSRD